MYIYSYMYIYLHKNNKNQKNWGFFNILMTVKVSHVDVAVRGVIAVLQTALVVGVVDDSWRSFVKRKVVFRRFIV